MAPHAPPPDWPHRETSRFIPCRPHLWHVQVMGAGPEVLLLHGAGGGTHSWRQIMPLLARNWRVIAIDLPGQGFTRLGARARCGVDPIAEDIRALCRQEGWQPAAVIGHSAGAALALRLAETMPLRAVIGINAALGAFEGVAGWLYPLMARLLAMTPFAAQIFSRIWGTEARVQSLLRATGSQIDAAGQAQYLTLLRNPAHVDATLAMMAQWQLDGLLARLPQQACPCLLITAQNDRAVPPEISRTAAARMPQAEWADLGSFGHLVQEENPGAVAGLINDFLAARIPAA